MHCATRDFAEQAEAKQRQCELEFRECEADMDIAELRADILQLREKYEPHELERERRANRVEDLAGRAALAKQANTALVDPSAKTKISFYKAQYPCYVLSLERLREHERLPVHEDALKAGRLDILTQTSTMPSSASARDSSDARCEPSDDSAARVTWTTAAPPSSAVARYARRCGSRCDETAGSEPESAVGATSSARSCCASLLSSRRRRPS